VELAHGDRIHLVKQVSVMTQRCITYVFRLGPGKPLDPSLSTPTPPTAQAGQREKTDKVEDDLLCGICQDVLEELQLDAESENPPARIVPCGHVFHASCIQKWVIDEARPSCPHCRNEAVLLVDAPEIRARVEAEFDKHPELKRPKRSPSTVAFPCDVSSLLGSAIESATSAPLHLERLNSRGELDPCGIYT
jgi:hypothetical protein